MRKNYFFVDRKIFKHKLTSAQFRMYLFFCKAANPSNKRCWNSFNDIANALGIKRTVVVKTVKELISMKLIRKYRIKKSDGSFSDNHYKVIPLQYTYKFRKRKRPCRSLLRQGLNICYKLAYASSLTSVKQTVAFVKRKSRKNLFFVTRGSPFFCSTYDSTHFYTNRKKNRIRLYLKYRCNLTLYY
jgi:predicted transcriptional regulator